jgi:UDP-N-acetylglucosamine 2-epimerase (non-hydrolysing)
MILIVYGTRPEIIKLFPLVRELKHQGLPFKTLFTGQHADLYDDVKDLMPEPDFFLPNSNLPDASLAQSFCQIFTLAQSVFAQNSFHIVIIQGDTTTACAIAQMAFYNQVRTGHVEAGLRTYDVENPFPEESNRKIISQISDLNFAPTLRACQNLEAERVRNIFLTGNTIVDALNCFTLKPSMEDIVVVTIHRRENHKNIAHIFSQLNQAAMEYPHLTFIFPMHPNPNVQRHKFLLTAKNLRVIDPLGYPEMLRYLSQSKFIISDSGGLQEEAVYLGKKIMIVREVTERPETIEVGLGKLVGTNIIDHLDWAFEKAPTLTENPYGDGNSSARIVDIISKNMP